MHFIASIAFVVLTALMWEQWGGWVIMCIVIGLPLLDYLMRDSTDR